MGQTFSIILASILTFLSAIAIATGTAALKFVITSGKELTLIRGKVDILYGFWEKEVYDAMRVIHKPHVEAKVLDGLLDRFKDLMDKFTRTNIQDNELIQLINILEIIRDDNNKPSGERLAASKVLNYIEMRYKLMQLGI